MNTEGLQTERAASLSVRLLRRAVEVRQEEVRALVWSWLYFFSVLSSYYILRPIRDDMGVAGGVRELPWLFTATLLAMLAVNPGFSALVSRLPRRRFIPIVYRFFMANLLLFFVLLLALDSSRLVWVGRVFFVWVSVFNLFVVSVFWAFMADTFQTEQSQRLFGFIGAGGTLGGLVGSGATALLVEWVEPVYLLLVSMLLLEVAVQCTGGLSRLWDPSTSRRQGSGTRERPIGGSALAGIPHILRSPFLLGICVYMLLYTITSTVLYFQQADLVGQAFADRAARTGFFAQIDFVVNGLTLLIQIFLTGRLIRILGVAVTLALLPGICLLGFAGLGLFPTIGILVVFQVLRRVGNFALTRPARETLYTVVGREAKYKAKSVIDTFVYRAGDQVGAWSYGLLGMLGLSMAGIALVSLPIAAFWLLVGIWLGKKQLDLAAPSPGPEQPKVMQPQVDSA